MEIIILMEFYFINKDKVIRENFINKVFYIITKLI